MPTLVLRFCLCGCGLSWRGLEGSPNVFARESCAKAALRMEGAAREAAVEYSRRQAKKHLRGGSEGGKPSHTERWIDHEVQRESEPGLTHSQCVVDEGALVGLDVGADGAAS